MHHQLWIPTRSTTRAFSQSGTFAAFQRYCAREPKLTHVPAPPTSNMPCHDSLLTHWAVPVVCRLIPANLHQARLSSGYFPMTAKSRAWAVWPTWASFGNCLCVTNFLLFSWMTAQCLSYTNPGHDRAAGPQSLTKVACSRAEISACLFWKGELSGDRWPCSF